MIFKMYLAEGDLVAVCEKRRRRRAPPPYGCAWGTGEDGKASPAGGRAGFEGDHRLRSLRMRSMALPEDTFWSLEKVSWNLGSLMR